MRLDQMRLDFRDAARLMRWSEDDKREIGAAIKAAAGNSELTALWSAWLASYAEEWRRMHSRLNKRDGEAA